MNDHTKKEYREFNVEDLIADSSFNQYVHRLNADVVNFWEQHIHENPHQRLVIEEAAFIISNLQFKKQIISAEKVREEWSRLSMAIDQQEEKSHSAFPWRIAASVAALVFLTAFVALLLYRTSDTEVSTAYGEIQKVILPDGSEVMLNANTTLRYADNWKENSIREVWLTGEAYFDVQKKNSQAQRFIVHSDEALVEVLGTQFNVNNRRGETTVVLSTGKVIVRKDLDKDTVVMKPGDMVTLLPHKNKTRRQRVNPALYSSWKDKKFIFNETPLTDITRLIEENFGMKVIVRSETLKNRKLSGEIMVDNLDVLLEALSKSFDIRVVRDRNTITLEDKI